MAQVHRKVRCWHTVWGRWVISHEGNKGELVERARASYLCAWACSDGQLQQARGCITVAGL